MLYVGRQPDPPTRCLPPSVLSKSNDEKAKLVL